jgi:ergothioneine biosynthesis protein EgtB
LLLTSHNLTSLDKKFIATRSHTEYICEPLEIEDFSVQPTDDVSPPKWHLAHSTWFFEQFVLVDHAKDYEVYDEDFAYLFNSYYNNAGERVLRPNRGLMTRPTVEQIMAYRKHVTDSITELLEKDPSSKILDLIEIGIHHEQQHQELLAYDIKYILGNQPTFPVYAERFRLDKQLSELKFTPVPEGLYTIGYQDAGYHFDNELGIHKVFLNNFHIANRLITNREYLAFIDAGGYEDFNLWHAEGWNWVQDNNIQAPLYWHQYKGSWHSYHYQGLEPLDLDLPVIHISYYEAFAFAEWKGMRLPTEFEWEVASELFHWGQLWEWTASAYLPYPGFSKAPGALGEYNGKFMLNQHVLRGGSVATPAGHSRKTYRNFFDPKSRWIFSGLRLAK